MVWRGAVGCGAGWFIGSPVIASSRRRRGEVHLSKGQSRFRPDLGRLRQEMDCFATLAMTCRKTVSIRRNYRAEGEASATARPSLCEELKRSGDGQRPTQGARTRRARRLRDETKNWRVGKCFLAGEITELQPPRRSAAVRRTIHTCPPRHCEELQAPRQSTEVRLPPNASPLLSKPPLHGLRLYARNEGKAIALLHL